MIKYTFVILENSKFLLLNCCKIFQIHIYHLTVPSFNPHLFARFKFITVVVCWKGDKPFFCSVSYQKSLVTALPVAWLYSPTWRSLSPLTHAVPQTCCCKVGEFFSVLLHELAAACAGQTRRLLNNWGCSLTNLLAIRTSRAALEGVWFLTGDTQRESSQVGTALSVTIITCSILHSPPDTHTSTQRCVFGCIQTCQHNTVCW